MRTPEFLKAPTKQPRLLLRRLRLRAARIDVELDVPKVRVGESHMVLTVHPDTLDRDSVVYSFGVGTETGWDLAMIERFGVTVHAFDPSPGCVEWVGQNSWPEKFVFQPIGIGDHDGTLKLFPPRTARTYNYSCLNPAGHDTAVEVPVKRFGTIAQELGHDRVDLLKIDIEGAEYAVLPDILESRVPVGQILIEFHHGYPKLSLDDTRTALALLRSHGYRIFDISRRAREFSLLKV